jgi:hypothetical protein
MCIYHIDGGGSWWRGVVDVGLPRKYPWIIDLVLGKRGVLVVLSANKQHRGLQAAGGKPYVMFVCS